MTRSGTSPAANRAGAPRGSRRPRPSSRRSRGPRPPRAGAPPAAPASATFFSRRGRTRAGTCRSLRRSPRLPCFDGHGSARDRAARRRRSRRRRTSRRRRAGPRRHVDRRGRRPATGRRGDRDVRDAGEEAAPAELRRLRPRGGAPPAPSSSPSAAAAETRRAHGRGVRRHGRPDAALGRPGPLDRPVREPEREARAEGAGSGVTRPSARTKSQSAFTEAKAFTPTSSSCTLIPNSFSTPRTSSSASIESRPEAVRPRRRTAARRPDRRGVDRPASAAGR